MNNLRYDRQVQIFGAQNQKHIENTLIRTDDISISICEMLKNSVLTGHDVQLATSDRSHLHLLAETVPELFFMNNFESEVSAITNHDWIFF